MPPPTKLLSKGPSINSLIKRCVSSRKVTVWYSKVQYSTVWYSTVQYSTVPKVSEDKRCQGCQGTKGSKGACVKSSEGLLRGRVFSRTHFRPSLTPEEGPSCDIYSVVVKVL